MSTKSTILLTNDKDEHFYFDCSGQYENKDGIIKDEITLEFALSNLRLESIDQEKICITITNVDSDLYKVFESLAALKELDHLR